MCEIKKVYDKLADLAQKHTTARATFDKMCEQHYGFTYNDCDFSIESNLTKFADDDEIIDTLDYGIDSLSFEKFNEKMMKAVKIINDNS